MNFGLIASNPSNIFASNRGIFICSIVGVDQCVDESLLHKRYVVYEIEFLRLSDGAKRVVKRRYRQLRRWYREVI